MEVNDQILYSFWPDLTFDSNTLHNNLLLYRMDKHENLFDSIIIHETVHLQTWKHI